MSLAVVGNAYKLTAGAAGDIFAGRCLFTRVLHADADVDALCLQIPDAGCLCSGCLCIGCANAHTNPACHLVLQGIVFSVRPPRKSWKNIANLSGGEKTLSSLSLVFALHHYKPTPLYVMDEIDAALGGFHPLCRACTDVGR